MNLPNFSFRRKESDPTEFGEREVQNLNFLPVKIVPSPVCLIGNYNIYCLEGWLCVSCI